VQFQWLDFNDFNWDVAILSGSLSVKRNMSDWSSFLDIPKNYVIKDFVIKKTHRLHGVEKIHKGKIKNNFRTVYKNKNANKDKHRMIVLISEVVTLNRQSHQKILKKWLILKMIIFLKYIWFYAVV